MAALAAVTVLQYHICGRHKATAANVVSCVCIGCRVMGRLLSGRLAFSWVFAFMPFYKFAQLHD